MEAAKFSSIGGASSAAGGAGRGTAGQPSMRDLVRSLVRSELLTAGGNGVAGPSTADGGAGGSSSAAFGELYREAAPRAFLQVFQRLSSAPVSRSSATEAASAEVVVSDLIAAHLLRTRQRDGRAADRHLRFHGLRRRMQSHPVLRDPRLRSSALELLLALRGGSDADGGAPGGGSSASGAKGLFPSKPLDAFPPPGHTSAPAATAAKTAPSGLASSLALPAQKAAAGGKQVGPAPALGWHVAGASGGPPTGISEERLLRDLLHALQGVDSACFKYEKASSYFVVDSSYLLSRPAWYLVQRVLELANLHMRLCSATAAVLEAESSKSLLQQALCEALRDQLRDYYKVLAMLMAKTADPPDTVAEQASGPPELTLRRLWTWLQAPLERMRLLVTLSEASVPLRGGALASTVHGCSRVGDTLAQDACASILRRVVAPLLAMMRAWMTEGELQDPYGEFFVCADASVPLEELWTRMYSLDIEMVPSFISLDLARKILLTGKSVNFIRLCCAGQEWLPPAEKNHEGLTAGSAAQQQQPQQQQQQQPALRRASSSSTSGLVVGVGNAASSRSTGLSGGSSGRQQPRQQQQLLALPGDARGCEDMPGVNLAGDPDEADFSGPRDLPLADLSARVEQAALRTNKHLVSLMMGQYKLGEHCLALRRFVLLGQGDFVESLLDAAGAELSKNANEVYRHQLQGIVEMAVRQTNAQWCSPDVLARLGVKLLQPSAGEKAWDIFLLDYAIDSPLHVVFTPAALQQYDRAFAFLWKLRRVSHGLAGCWSQQMALQRHLVSCSPRVGSRAPELRLEMRQTLHKCTCLRNEIHHFVQNIHSYIMCEVLETSWAKLQAGWQTCVDLDQVILEHQRYLSCIEEGAFLAPRTEPILTALMALLGLALEFTELHDQVCASAFEAIDVLSSEPDGPLPFARSLAESRAQLDQLGASFLARLQSLLRALEAQPALRHLTSDLRFLLCRLDFNGYYEQKRVLR